MCDHSAVCLQDPLEMEQLLPLEIWETILKKLPSPDLLRASTVCRQWRHLARRVCRERCHRLPARLLAELTHEYYNTHIPTCTVPPTSLNNNNEIVTDDELMTSLTEYQDRVQEPDWLDINRMLMQTAVTACAEDCLVMQQLQQVTHLATAGDFVVVVSHSREKNVSIIRIVGKTGQECCKLCINDRILKVCVMEMPETPSILAVCVNKDLRCYMVGPQLNSLTPLTVSPELSVDSRLCCDGYTMVVSQMVDEHHLSIYRASLLIEQGHVELCHEGRIKTSSPPVYWDLWNGFVTTVVSAGHVVSYTLSGNLVAESPLYKDLRYPNPTLLVRGLIFASTITSRTLLFYWHMDRGRDYWLVGESVLTSWVQRGPQAVGNTSCIRKSQVKVENDYITPTEGSISDEASKNNLAYSEPASSCIVTLAKVRVGATMLLEVTVINYRRGLVFCGTSQGHLLLYKILTDDKASDLKINWAVMESYVPSLCLSVTSRPVSRLAAYFRNSDIVVAVSDREGNCFVLSLPNIHFASEE